MPKTVSNWQRAGFGLYLHWPFCQSKCPYCDFNSHVQETVDHDLWAKAYSHEIERLGTEFPDRILKSIFFGGGTPSLMSPKLVETIIEKASQYWSFSNDIEITLEANPSSVEISKFQGFKLAGVNRVSVGVQALNDPDLRRLGRLHDVKTALSSIEISQNIFERSSFDLIYARQDQTLSDWENELKLALSYAGQHLSLYQLTIEENTVFGERWRRGQLKGIPDENLAADLYLLTQDLCDAQGLYAYEISNHASLKHESRHNVIYWKNGDYLGIGPGAHGRITKNNQRIATSCPLSPQKWLENITRFHNGEDDRAYLSADEWSEEYIIMGLRLSSGLLLSEYKELFNKDIKKENISNLVNNNFLTQSDDYIKTTISGKLLLNRTIYELIK